MFHEIESETFDDGSSVSVGRDREGQYMLVCDGPGGLETVIRFDAIQLKRNAIVFRVADSTYSPNYIQSGQIERGGLGAVGAWIEAFAEVGVTAS